LAPKDGGVGLAIVTGQITVCSHRFSEGEDSDFAAIPVFPWRDLEPAVGLVEESTCIAKS